MYHCFGLLIDRMWSPGSVRLDYCLLSDGYLLGLTIDRMWAPGCVRLHYYLLDADLFRLVLDLVVTMALI